MSKGSQVRPAVLRFAELMEEKLSEHDGERAHWSGCNLGQLFRRLLLEAEELREAIDENEPLHMMMEAADIANFAMMIADNAERLSREKETGDE